MQKVIISDTSCLIQFELIGELNLLKRLFGSVTITPEIAGKFHSPIPDWIIIKGVKNKTYQKILETSINKCVRHFYQWRYVRVSGQGIEVERHATTLRATWRDLKRIARWPLRLAWPCLKIFT
jgi:hypothetical protein